MKNKPNYTLSADLGLQELDLTEQESTEGGILAAIAVGLTVVGGLYYFGTQLARAYH